jgi:hypothetical protein
MCVLQVASTSNTDETLTFACMQHVPDALACQQVASQSNTDEALNFAFMQDMLCWLHLRAPPSALFCMLAFSAVLRKD